MKLKTNQNLKVACILNTTSNSVNRKNRFNNSNVIEQQNKWNERK